MTVSGLPSSSESISHHTATPLLHAHAQYNLVHISVGDILREEVKNNTSAGTKAKDYMDKGLLVRA